LIAADKHDFYRYVPEDAAELLRFRRTLLRKGDESEKWRDLLWQACRADFLFWINGFCWLLEPRQKKGRSKTLLFNSRFRGEYQNTAFLQMLDAIGERDIVVDKSREMGATWMVLYLFYWFWQFHPQSHFGIVSKDEATTDTYGDPRSLFGKLDFIYNHQPWWLRPRGFDPEHDRTKLKLLNPENGSSFIGSAAGKDIFSGGRYLSIFGDEVSKWVQHAAQQMVDSTQYTTNSRVLNSTHKGAHTVFARMVREKKAHRTLIVLDWKDDPQKAAGLYTSVDG
jgi:hypothetical protein